jgi:hypothetical protein
MINNIPTPQEFENLGLDCISKSFEMLFTISNKYNEISQDEIISQEVSKEEFWRYNDITVRTSLIVLFQGIEYLMKMKVTEKSALLLIENERAEWPSLPQKKDKNFDELMTISGERLLGVFCAVTNETTNLNDFVLRFEELRSNRNKLVHSTGINNLDHKYLVKEILYFLSEFYSKTKWIELFRKMFISEPAFGYWDWDVENAYFYKVLNFVEESLSKAEINKYLNYNIKSRRYYCPECTYWLKRHEFEEVIPKWAFLDTEESNVIYCVICDKNHQIERKDCIISECKGNVVSSVNIEDQCLTCFEE